MGKINRLYAITVYLLNNGKATVAELSRKFEVSVRIVQRDTDSLCQAGIPIVAETLLFPKIKNKLILGNRRV